MNRLFSILVAMALTGVVVSCGEKKKNSNIIITHKPVAPVVKETQKMNDDEQSHDVSWVGSNYKVVVQRMADISLPVVQIDDYTKYYDNKITVRVLRKDGTEFFNHAFTKADFDGYLDQDTKDTGVLQGIVFVKAEGDELLFAASVGSPDAVSDEYVPMVVEITRMGAISISPDTSLDTE